MLSPLLVLAQVAAPAAEAPTGVSKILGDFGVTWPSILAQMLSFSIVAFVLWKLAFKPVLATLDERQKKIADGLRYSDEMKAKLEAAQQAYEAQMREAQTKAQQIVAEAQKVTKEFSDKQHKEAIENASALITKAQEAIELEKKKMLAEARTEIARLVVATTQRVLARELDDGERSRFNESAARELTSA